MEIAIICFTRSGYELGRSITEQLNSQGDICALYYKSRHMTVEDGINVTGDLKEWTGKMFATRDAILFIGACGIAVRSIAPFVSNKKQDPAVVVLDEQGKFSISLLSGHLGRANELTLAVAGLVHAQPVITTATDLNGKFAVDVFARRNECSILDMKLAKDISAVILQGKSVNFFSELPTEGKLPGELKIWEEGAEIPDYGIVVSPYSDYYNRKKLIAADILQLIPKVITLGIGCRRDTPREHIEKAVDAVLKQQRLSHLSIYQVSSIDVKADEPGLLEFCRKWQLPLRTYSAERLNQVPGEFDGSHFVLEQVGVDNVCERSAVLASGGGEIIQKKYSLDGVTVAAVLEKRRIRFE